MIADLVLSGVRKAYDGVLAVDGVSFEVPRGTLFSLLGPSGCGKTTILRIVAGFIAADAGEIDIRGSRVTTAPPYRRDTAMVFQSYALFPHMTVYDNVAFGLRYRNVPRQERSRKVGLALDRVRLTGHDRRFPFQLSGGQQQRVALARAIVTEPALLLLDEPLSNLDLRLRQQMRSELRAIQTDSGLTTVYVTHDQAEAFSMSDYIAVMNRGQLVQVGSPADIFLRPADEFVLDFVGETNRLAGSVVNEGDGAVTLNTDGGLLFRVELADGEARRHPVGVRRFLYFREEQVVILDASKGVNSFPGTIEAIQNLGSTHTYAVRLAEDVVLRATSATTFARSIELRQSVWIHVDPRDCVLVASGQYSDRA